MKQSFICSLAAALVFAGLSALAQAPATNTPEDRDIEVLRKTLQADRQATIAQSLQLTGQESQRFWPLYNQYRTEMDKVGDGLVKLVKEYAGYYPNIPDDRAKQMLKDMTRLQEQQVATRTSYLKKFSKVLPPAKTLRFAQLENRMDLVTQLKLAANIPITPIEGRLTGTASGRAVAEKGVPGGTVVQTYDLTATVAAIDRQSRRVTLVDPSGIKSTVTVGPEAINLDQLRVGDRVQVTATQRLVVSLAKPGQAPLSPTGTDTVLLAPKGAKPGGMRSETTQTTARVVGLDPEQHEATLQFADGTSATVPVRPDVDLSRAKIGDTVVIRLTESQALRVEKP